jgi:hypothetical protein
MLSSNFIEDIFIGFFEHVVSNNDTRVFGHDFNPTFSFYQLLLNGNPPTQAQADYIIRILTKYLHLAKLQNYNYSAALSRPEWKQQFRVIDQSKRIHIEKDEHGIPMVCLKFPYQLKKEFEETILINLESFYSGTWDPERKIRILPMYNCNLVQVHEFVKKYGFDIDDSFLDALSEIEEIWLQEDNIIPSCEILDGQVMIKNVSSETYSWWVEHKNGTLENDLLLAKHMHLKFLGEANSLVEKIASSSANNFWIKDIPRFLDLCDKIQGRIVVVLDRSYDAQSWVRDFIAHVDTTNFDKSNIKVCFRSKREKEDGFNEWIKEQGLGGIVEYGKILIFDNKPAKWLFTKDEDVKLLVTNNLFPHTQTMTREWLHSHACVIHLGNIKPTPIKDQDIVEL